LKLDEFSIRGKGEKVNGVTAPIKPKETKEDKQESQTNQKPSGWFK
jgi:hypothetical protein